MPSDSEGFVQGKEIVEAKSAGKPLQVVLLAFSFPA